MRRFPFFWWCYYWIIVLLVVAVPPNYEYSVTVTTALLISTPTFPRGSQHFYRTTGARTTTFLQKPASSSFPSNSRSNNNIKNHTSFDLIVIGGGSAGLTAAKFASTVKKKCLIIEGSPVLGGDCTWNGCVPSKSLLASAKASQIVRRQSMTRSSTSSTSSNSNVVPWTEIQQRFRNIQQEIYEKDDSPNVLANMNIHTQVQGRATVTSPRTVSVTVAQQDTTTTTNTTTTTLTFEATQGIVLCTGATPKPATKMILGLEESDDSNDFVITYEDVWDLTELPKRMTVVGGGPIGCELAQAFGRLGSKVTIIASQRLLPREEPEVSEILKQVFEEEGITVILGRVASVAKHNNSNREHGTHTVTTNNGDTVVGDVLLVSIGRVPNTKGLGLETVGIALNDESSKNGGIKVNDKLETTCKGIYAAGDCTGDQQFTHYAGYQGAIAARNILLPLSDAGVLSDVPSTIFTSPEVASIGYTEAQARKELGDQVVGVSIKRLDEVDRALCDGNRLGILKVLYHKRNGKILGATIMTPAAGELISEIAVARSAGMRFDALAKVIHPYPSYAIALQLMAADVYYEKTTQMLWLYNFLKRIGL